MRNIASDVFDQVLSAAEIDKAMPAQAYTSPEYFALEQRLLFRRTWVLVGVGQEIPNPGDTMPADVAGYPIFIMRRKDGSLSAYHNVCPHRGAIIVTKPCTGLRNVTCPYHSWSYNPDGTLRMRPYYHGGKNHDVADHKSGNYYPSLKPVRIAMFGDMIFANMDGNAPPLEEHLKPAIDYFDGYDFSVMQLAESLNFEVNANWKLPIENFYDNYHIFALHPLINAGYPQDRRGPSEWLGGPFLKGGFRVEGGGAADWIRGMARNPNICDRLKNYNSFIAIAPNVLAQVWDFTVVIFQIMPVSECFTRERIYLYYFGECATSSELEQPRKVIADTWYNINQNEDIHIVENMHRARHSPVFDHGELSPFWDSSTVAFTKIISGLMSQP